jgi:hypothetical protein
MTILQIPGPGFAAGQPTNRALQGTVIAGLTSVATITCVEADGWGYGKNATTNGCQETR